MFLINTAGEVCLIEMVLVSHLFSDKNPIFLQKNSPCHEAIRGGGIQLVTDQSVADGFHSPCVF